MSHSSVCFCGSHTLFGLFFYGCRSSSMNTRVQAFVKDDNPVCIYKSMLCTKVTGPHAVLQQRLICSLPLCLQRPMRQYLPVLCSSGPPWPLFSSPSSPSTRPLGRVLLFFLFSCFTQIGGDNVNTVHIPSLRNQTAGADLRGDIFGRLNADGRVPLPWREDRDLVQEFINSSDNVVAVFSLVGHIMEHLMKRTFIEKYSCSYCRIRSELVLFMEFLHYLFLL